MTGGRDAHAAAAPDTRGRGAHHALPEAGAPEGRTPRAGKRERPKPSLPPQAAGSRGAARTTVPTTHGTQIAAEGTACELSRSPGIAGGGL